MGPRGVAKRKQSNRAAPRSNPCRPCQVLGRIRVSGFRSRRRCRRDGEVQPVFALHKRCGSTGSCPMPPVEAEPTEACRSRGRAQVRSEFGDDFAWREIFGGPVTDPPGKRRAKQKSVGPRIGSQSAAQPRDEMVYETEWALLKPAQRLDAHAAYSQTRPRSLRKRSTIMTILRRGPSCAFPQFVRQACILVRCSYPRGRVALDGRVRLRLDGRA